MLILLDILIISNYYFGKWCGIVIYAITQIILKVNQNILTPNLKKKQIEI